MRFNCFKRLLGLQNRMQLHLEVGFEVFVLFCKLLENAAIKLSKHRFSLAFGSNSSATSAESTGTRKLSKNFVKRAGQAKVQIKIPYNIEKNLQKTYPNYKK